MAKQDKTATAEWDDIAAAKGAAVPTQPVIPADQFRACAAYLRTHADPDKGKAAGAACRDFAKEQLKRPDLPKRHARQVEVLSTPGLADELAARAQDGTGWHEWDAIHAALVLHFPE